MKSLMVLVASGIIIGSCNSSIGSKVGNNELEVKQLLFEQQKSWNEGDLEGFMAHYWNNEDLCFLSKRGINCGWQNVFENYKKNYSSNEKMGKLDFTILRSESFNDTTQFVVGRWKVSRNSDTLQGSFNLVWKIKNGKWVIVFDHTS